MEGRLMIVIRPASVDDDAVLADFGRKFYEYIGSYHDVPYCTESAARWFALLRELGVLLIAEVDGQAVGMAGALWSPFIFNDQYKVGAEIFWWINPEHRSGGVGREMLAKLESAAQDAGCVRFSMMSVADHDRLGKIYGLAGYEPAERTYVKAWPA